LRIIQDKNKYNILFVSNKQYKLIDLKMNHCFVKNEYIVPGEFPIISNEKDCNKEILNISRGLYLMSNYWQDNFVKYELNYLNSYQFEGLDDLESNIRRLHNITSPNNNFKGKKLVIGLSATNLLNAILYAIYTKLKRVISVTVRTPGYLDIRDTIPIIHQHRAIFKANVDNADVEFIATPNNPDGKIQHPQKNIKYNVYDRVNFWEWFVDEASIVTNETFENEDITIFSIPKLNGLSGSRIGYAFIKDEELAKITNFYAIFINHGLNSDSQIRHLKTLKILNKGGYQEFRNYMVETMKKRWKKSRKAISLDKNLILRNSAGPNLWIEVLNNNAKKYFMDKYKIIGTYGEEYDSTDNYIRISIICTDCQFKDFIRRLRNNN